MAKEKELGIKPLIEFAKQSKIGSLIAIKDYKDFKKEIIAYKDKGGNIADLIGDIEKEIAIKIEAGKDIKNIVDANAKNLNNANKDIRCFLVDYMIENKIDRFDGKEIKSITLQEEKTIKGILTIKEIKIGNKYVEISSLSKEDIIEELVKQGYKTRLQTREVIDTKPASLIIRK